MLVIVEGNIGSGKSTFLAECERQMKNVVAVYEQVHDWTNLTDSSGKSMFDLYYLDKPKYAYVFQTYVLMSRVAALMRARRQHPDAILLCERSFLTDYEIFAKCLYESGDITEMEWNVYNLWHGHIKELFGQPIVGTIYLRATPEKCLERIQKRQRQSEDTISIDYVRSVHHKHEEWLMGSAAANSNILVLNANEELPNLDKHVEAVVKFIDGLRPHSCTHLDSTK